MKGTARLHVHHPLRQLVAPCPKTKRPEVMLRGFFVLQANMLHIAITAATTAAAACMLPKHISLALHPPAWSVCVLCFCVYACSSASPAS